MKAFREIRLFAAMLAVALAVVMADWGTASAQPAAGDHEATASHEGPALEDRVIGTPEPSSYTLGADDVISITVRQHPEFSGTYSIGKDGKIQYRMIGDVVVGGMNKDDVAVKIAGLLTQYVNEPQVDVAIVDFKSKVIYVVGEVARPGRYFIRGESIPVRDVVFEAGLPTLASAMRRTMIIHPPDSSGRIVIEKLNLYALLYLGEVKRNVSLHSGDILYVPSTVFHKAARVLDPVLDPLYKAAVLRRIAD